ncbi:MAG: hypothetical protein H8E22_01785 [Candidatus Cloacimonetes bacterium]|nr:hypothetical protein [Candidatus Cloacimonadota bacterium]
MNNPKIYHYRDHYNGGKFDGNCKIDTGWGIHEDGNGDVNQIRIRLRIEDFDSGFQYIWGVGSGNFQYALILVRDTNDYYFKVRYLNKDFTFPDFRIPLSSKEIYTIKVKKEENPSYSIILFRYAGKYDEYEDLMQDIDPTTGSISGSNIYIGCSSDVGNNNNNFTGTIFDYDTYNDDATPLRQRLVFYEKYDGTNKDKVYDFFNHQDADITDRPDDFWSFKKNISNYISKKGSLQNKYKESKTRKLEYTSFKFSVFDYDEITIEDTIGVYIDDKLSHLYRVIKIKPKIKDYINEIECEDIFTDFENFNINSYSWYLFPAYDENDPKWWSNYVKLSGDYNYPTGTDYWVAALFLLRQAIYVLQYDNILTVTTMTCQNTESPYYDYNSSVYRHYSLLVFPWVLLRYINRSSATDWDNCARMDDVLLDILFVLRLTYYINDGELEFHRLGYGTASFPNNKTYNREGPYEENYPQYNNVVVDICKHATEKRPDLSIFSTPITTIEDNSGDLNISDYSSDLVEDINLPAHLWLAFEYSNVLIFFRDTADSQNFTHQLAEILDAELRGIHEYKDITILLTSEKSDKYWKRTDDIKNMKTEIKIRV